MDGDEKKEAFSIFDWIGTVIGIVVVGFILFFLIWPAIDPTPDKSSSLKHNLERMTGN